MKRKLKARLVHTKECQEDGVDGCICLKGWPQRKRKLKAGRWFDRKIWICMCHCFRYSCYTVKSCTNCHAQRPRKGFGGGRPKI